MLQSVVTGNSGAALANAEVMVTNLESTNTPAFGNPNRIFLPITLMNTKSQFVICINNEAYPASLQLWKVYRVLPDEKGARHNMIRVIDESGEDYLFPASYFVPVKLPQAVKLAMLATA